MRVERLSADNQRMQGAERRLWLERYSNEHLGQCGWLTGVALSQRAPDAPRTAAILGAGACTEVPLATVARTCDAVTLVDLDAPGIGRARDECPQRLRPRIHLVAADLTGGVSVALREEMGGQPWRDLRALAGSAVLDALAGCLERVTVPDPPEIGGLEPHSFGMVISTLTLTQLYSLPLLDALDILLAYAPDLAGRRDAHPRYASAARDFRRRVTRAHLALIARLLAPGGSAALITDTVGYLIPPTSGPHARAGREAFETLPASALAWPDDLLEWFTMAVKPCAWGWMVAMPQGETPGRAYDVVGAVMRAR